MDHQQRFMADSLQLTRPLRVAVPPQFKDALQTARRELAQGAFIDKYQRFFEILQPVQDLGSWTQDVRDDAVRFLPQAVSDEQRAVTDRLTEWFKPWKKGPYCIGDHAIDAEWRSEIKWQRLAPFLDEVAGKTVLDIGAHTGYFMYRLAELEPDWVLGIDPMVRHALQFYWFQLLHRDPRLYFELLGVEHLTLFPRAFDIVLCLGIIYHFTDPVEVLRNVKASLRPGGFALIDAQGIAGDSDMALMPRLKYMGNKGFWWLPTASCLTNMIHRAGFKQVDLVFSGALTTAEQRATNWAPISSLGERLKGEGVEAATEEGYPAPWRFYFRAQV